MLSGRRAIRSEVLREDVDWAALPAKTPAFVRRLLARCLDRDVKRRLRDIGEARIVLEDSNPADTGAAPGKPRPLWRPAMVALGAFGAGAIAGSLWYSSREPPPPRNVTRFRFDLPEGQVFTGLSGRAVALSPDGTQLAYVANGRLYLRSLAEQDAKPIRGTEGLQAVADAVFSPDGRSLAFHAVYDQTLKRIAVTGGAAVTIARAELPSGIDWGPDGIVYGQGAKGILRVSPDGGAPETLVRVKDGEFAHGPQLLPDGRHVLFTLVAGPSPDSRSALVVVQTLTSGERKTLVNGGADARYVRSGHLVYALGGNLLAVPFDARRLEVAGSPVPVVEGVRRAVGGVASNFTVSGSGSLAYVPGPATASGAADLDLAVIDRKGGLRPLKLPPGTYSVPRVSPDGTRVAFGTVDGTEATISTYSLSGTSAIRRVTFGSNNRFPVWTSDSTRITFQSDRDGDQAIYWQRVDGAGTAERLTTPDPGTSHEPESWSPDGAFLLYNVTKDSDVSLSSFSLRDRKSKPFGDVHSLTRTNAVFSPDGRWVAYASTEQGRSRTLVSPFPPTGAGHQLPAEYAHQPLWAPSGKELFFNPRPGALAAVSVSTSPTLAFGFPVEFTRLFQTGPPTVRRAFDITPGGQFVGLIGAGAAESEMRQMNSQVRIVLNWLEELKQRVPW
jgi:serine/threonine-protein kinase